MIINFLTFKKEITNTDLIYVRIELSSPLKTVQC